MQDEVEREDRTSGGQPIEYEDYPDTTDYGVQVAEDNIYEGGLDYNHGDEEYDWEEDGSYDSF